MSEPQSNPRSPRTFPMHELIACVEREIAMRRKVYPQWVASKRMTQAMADAELAKMEAVLQVVREHEEVARNLAVLADRARPFAKAAQNMEGLQNAILAHWSEDDGGTCAWWLAAYAAALKVSPAQWVGLRKSVMGE